MWLRLRGYRVAMRNVRMGTGEIDLIVVRRAELRVVEVRTVSTAYLSAAHLACDPGKLRRMRDAVHRLPKLLDGWKGTVHVDVIAVRLRWGFWPRFTWLRDVEL
jgi:Holliday junction resolvase-like predicted endonuclease